MGMEDTLSPIVERFARELEAWIESPSESSGQIEALRSQIEGLKGTLSGEALKTMQKALKDAEAGVKKQRQKSAGQAIASRMRELGIRLEAGAPMKRRGPRKKAAASNGETQPEPGGEASTAS